MIHRPKASQFKQRYEKWRRDRLPGVTYPDGTIETQTYFINGKRWKKENAEGTVLFIWDEENVLQEKDGSGVTQVQYTDYPGMWSG